MKDKKKWCSALFLVVVFSCTCYAIFKENDLSTILHWITKVKKEYILFAMLLVPVFVVSESVIISYLMKHFGTKVPLRKSCIYSFIGFFYSCITPSATGGQPMQLVYMKKDKIDLSEASIVLLIITIGYKMVLVLIGGLVILLRRAWLHQIMGKFIGLCYLGMVLNVICIAWMCILVFSRKIAPWLIRKAEHIGVRLRILNKSEKRREKIQHTIQRYQDASKFLVNNKGVFIPVFLLSLFQRVVLFYTTYLVYKGFGLSGTSCMNIIVIQALISLSVDMLPLPGGMGISEGLFAHMYQPVFGQVLIVPAMLLSRWISFYCVLFISAVITLIAFFVYRRRKVSNSES